MRMRRMSLLCYSSERYKIILIVLRSIKQKCIISVEWRGVSQRWGERLKNKTNKHKNTSRRVESLVKRGKRNSDSAKRMLKSQREPAVCADEKEGNFGVCLLIYEDERVRQQQLYGSYHIHVQTIAGAASAGATKRKRKCARALPFLAILPRDACFKRVLPSSSLCCSCI